jgi:hypothetical protein
MLVSKILNLCEYLIDEEAKQLKNHHIDDLVEVQTLVEKEASTQNIRTVTKWIFSRGSGGDPRPKVTNGLGRQLGGGRGISPSWPGQPRLKPLPSTSCRPSPLGPDLWSRIASRTATKDPLSGGSNILGTNGDVWKPFFSTSVMFFF